MDDWREMKKQLIQNPIGLFMNVYRKSPFHGPKTGAFLAKLLSYVSSLQGKDSLVKKSIDGINYQLDLNEVIDSSLFYSGTFEPRVEETIASLVHKNMTVFDIGANIGYHTFRFARTVGPMGRVFAIEPTKWAYNKLMKNAELNPDLSNISFLKIGLSDQDVGETVVSFQSSYRLDGRTNNVQETISIQKLDTIIEKLNLEVIDFMKIDVDGYEGKIIRGAYQSLLKFRPILFFEFTPTAVKENGDDPLELIQTIETLQYNFYSEDRKPIANIYHELDKIAKDSSVMVLAIPSNGIR